MASVDPATGEATTAIVSATPARLFEGTIYDITVDPGEPGGGDETTISATGEHPFLVARAGPHAAALDTRADPEAVALVEPLDTRDRTGQDRTGQDLAGHGRWVPASDLAEGDAVRTMSPQGVAGTATVTKIRGRHAVAPVYNLTVEGTSRYLVGACGVVVHNKGEGAAPDEIVVYRVFGGDARAQGFSWTTVDPRRVSNFRDAAGLPSGGPSGSMNSADFLIMGRARASSIIKSRPALPLDGNRGGLPELIIDPRNVELTDFCVLNR